MRSHPSHWFKFYSPVVNKFYFEPTRPNCLSKCHHNTFRIIQELVNRNSSVETFSDDLHSSDSGVRQRTSPFTRNYSTKQEQVMLHLFFL